MSDESGDPDLEARLAQQDTFDPPASFVDQANVTDPDLADRFEAAWPECWTEAADLLDWETPYETVLDDSNPPFFEWFTGGELNASTNCIDRHLASRGDEPAIEWVGEPTDEPDRTLTYADLHREVNEFAAALRDIGVGPDDVVTLYLPMIPELPIAMLACARIGAPHSVVFAGFSAEALATRMNAADSTYLVTADGYYRRGDAIDHLSKAETGIDAVDHPVEATIVVDRLREDSADHDHHTYETLVADHAGATVEPVARDAEDMLFLMYTSGTTGEPKGVKHTTGGYLAWVTWTARTVLDITPEDTYFCSADIGWITGHSYIVYGPLALGTTTTMYEGAPDHPDRDRLWTIIESLEADQFYTAPTAIRAFMKWGTAHLEGHDLSSLRLLGTVGEPINPRAWKWYYKHIGDESCPVVDTWWQTETGGMLVTTIPGVDQMKPGAAGPALPGIDAAVVDGQGEPVEPGSGGYLTIQRPWPGMLRTLYQNDQRYIDEYWAAYSDTDSDDPADWVYFPEDSATIDEDGYITVLGRVDDVLNVSGHRLGTMEIESAIVDTDGVAEAAVVGADHEITGDAVHAYVILTDDTDPTEAMRSAIEASVEEAIGPIARPESIVFTPELPKTRSGKIMRRLLEAIANGEDLGDTSTLRNPAIVEDIRRQVQDD
ncbi:MAG: acetate--CoA ligase [Halobacteriaceae archaeon]